MVSSVSSISNNFEVIKENIRRYSDSPEKVRILGVTKFQPIERVLEAIDLGISLLGVNYVQEGQKLKEAIKRPDLEWHFIGHIQSRKAKHLINYECVQSLERLDIAQDLNRRLESQGKHLSVLVEVNIGHEPQKSGVFPEDLNRFFSELKALRYLNVRGLMAMPPPLSNEERRPFFKKMKELYNELSGYYPFDTLSIGTSDDYSIALQEGANLIRLGTCLFGPRW
ncbi:MAG: YggS family pyridoxal phosphate-dependent enzyme [Pseudomonadota bacterium]